MRVKSNIDRDQLRHDFVVMGLPIKDLRIKYKTSYNTLRPILEESIKRKPRGSNKLPSTIKEMIGDIRSIYNEGNMSDYQWNQYLKLSK